jgi:hypothetical protein
MTPHNARRQDVELAFVLAPGQNLFFSEIVEALRKEAESLAVATSVHLGTFPPPQPKRVYVLVPAHEYFTLMQGRHAPSVDTLKRTVFISAEQPGTSHFADNLVLAPRAGAILDINAHAVAAYRAAGVPAQHLQLGWTSSWDHLSERERDIDVLFMGCFSDRRAAALASYAKTLFRRRTCYVLSDNSKPNWVPSESFRIDEEKWDLLGRAKVILNIHQDENLYFEWLRVVQAISNGAVVVSDQSVAHAPLVPGRHFLAGRLETLGLLTSLLLDDGDKRWRIQTEAYRMLRQELPLRAGVQKLIEAAAGVARAAPVPAADPFFHEKVPDIQNIPVFRSGDRPPSPSEGNVHASALRRALKDVKLELLGIRRQLSRVERTFADGHPPARLKLVRRTRAYRTTAPRVSVLMALYNYEEHLGGSLESLLSSYQPSWELIVVDDGSTDRSGAVAEAWLREHEDVAALLLRHPVNQGLAHARNSALAWARGEHCFILDADNEMYPHCLELLLEALDADRNAAFAYGIHERFGGGQSLGLANVFPWQPWRFRTGNYIDAMAMIRTQILREKAGGYSVDHRLHGWEDYDLWCKLADAGLRGAFVPEVVARYRSTEHSMLSLTNLSYTDAFSVLIERHRNVLAGVRPPA